MIGRQVPERYLPVLCRRSQSAAADSPGMEEPPGEGGDILN